MDRQKVIIIVAASFLFIFLALLIVMISNNTEPKIEKVRYTLDFPLVLPKEPGYAGEYLFSHIPRDRWSQEEVDEWFVVPTGENLERLHSANDQVIIKILEAAP